MKLRPEDEMDEAIRQALNRLPDAPPPGSSFDSGRLWSRLHTQLPEAPRRRRFAPLGWAALVLLIGGWLVWTKLLMTDVPIAEKITLAPRPVVKGASEIITPNAPLQPAIERQKPEEGRIAPRRRTKSGTGLTPVGESTDSSQSAPLLTQRLSELPVSDTVVGTPIAANKAPKRRFRLMHVNELPAPMTEPVIYRTEGFVRLGSGLIRTPDADKPAQPLRFPLKATNN